MEEIADSVGFMDPAPGVRVVAVAAVTPLAATACDLTQPCAVQAAKDMLTSYFALGPPYWLGAIVALWLFKRAFGFLAFLFIGSRKDRP